MTFKSENMLKSAAAKAGASEVEKKLNNYLEKIGVKKGTFSYTFKKDNTFTTTFKGKSFNGTYKLSDDGKTISINYSKSLDLLKMNADIATGTDNIDLMFNADSLLVFIGKISATTGNSTLKGISAIASQYDGMSIGFELKK